MRGLTAKVMVIALGLITLWGCEKTRAPSPLIGSLPSPQLVVKGSLAYGDTANTTLDAGRWVGYSYSAEKGHELTLTYGANGSFSKPLLMAIYGPRSTNGQFGEALLTLGIDPGKTAGALSHTVATTGEYLVVIGNPSLPESSTVVSIALSCAGSCSTPQCQTLDQLGCAAVNCPTEFVKDASGCLTCQCKTVDCEPGHVLIAGRCVKECTCLGGFVPVCANGKTFKNLCEAQCYGHFDSVAGACPSTCSKVSCDTTCVFGYATDDKGCKTCACRPAECKNCTSTYNPVCGSDGVTYLNLCRAACAGARPLYAGRCITPCKAGDPGCPAQCKSANISCPDLGSCSPMLGIVPDSNGCHSCSCATVCDKLKDDPSCQTAQPVCAARVKDGTKEIVEFRTFTNHCLATCAGYIVVYQESCPVFSCTKDADCEIPDRPQIYGCNKTNKKLEEAGITSAIGLCIAKPEGLNCGDPQGKPDPSLCLPGYSCKTLGGKPVCRSACGCSRLLNPVCGNDGVTYPNACVALCTGVSIDHPGPCCSAVDTNAASCPDGRAVSYAGCVTKFCRSEAADCTACTSQQEAVCGHDGITYASQCLAHCAGVQLSTATNNPGSQDKTCPIPTP